MRVRRLLLAAAAVLAVIAVACGGGDEAPDTPTPAASPQAQQPSGAPSWVFTCDETPAATAPDSAAFPLQVQDDAGRTVSLDVPPAAIVSLSAGHTEMVYAIGAGNQLVAGDTYSDCPEAAKDLPRIDAFSPSVESIVALEPDLVIVYYDPGSLVDTLEADGITAMMLEAPVSIEGVLGQMELLGKVTGHPAGAATAVASIRDSIQTIADEVSGAVSGPTVFHEVDNTYYTAGPGSFIDDLYRTLKAHNIAESTGEAYPQMSAEAIIAADPEVIVLADEDAGESAATVAKRPGWSGIAAVKDGRVYPIDPDIVSRPGPRLVQALDTLARYLYPEVFD